MDFTKYKITENRVLVEVHEASHTTASGLILADTGTESVTQATVRAVGTGRRNKNGDRVAVDLAVGDRVIYSGGGIAVTIDGFAGVILNEDEVLAVIDEWIA